MVACSPSPRNAAASTRTKSRHQLMQPSPVSFLGWKCDMADVLNAASLLFAVIAALYALWYPELNSDLAVKIPDHKEDRPARFRKTAALLWSRALPLLVISLSTSLTFLPIVVLLLSSSAERYLSGTATWSTY